MVTARYYEDQMKELTEKYEKKCEYDPVNIRQRMDQLNIETLASLGYMAGAKIYAEATGVKLKYGDNC